MYVGRDTTGRFRPRFDRRDQRLSIRCAGMDLLALDEIAEDHNVSRSEVALEILRDALQRGNPIERIGPVPYWPSMPPD